MAGSKHYGRYSKTVTALTKLIEKAIPNARVLLNFPMSRFTTFRTGGNAEILVEIDNIEDFVLILNALSQNNIDFIVLGNGSNILVSDNGLTTPALIPKFNNLFIDNNFIYAQAGCSLKMIANFAAKNSLSGLEFASGIPGTFGGGIIMNAGAYGSELKDLIIDIDIWDYENGKRTISAKDADFSYRHSIFSDNGAIITGASLKLSPLKSELIYNKMNELTEKRRLKQPLNYPSAGSVFKRPDNNYAGTLIEQCGLKGTREGGAQVSEKHAGFIVNTGNATSSDVYRLIKRVIKEVKSKTDIELEPEIKFIGDFN